MKAIGLQKYLPLANPQSLLDLEIDKPSPKGFDLLARVKAISVNPVDYKIRSPKDKVEPSPRILGWDVSGVVEAVGDNCSLFVPGDEVYYAGDLTRPGGNSEYHLVDERIVGKKPSSLTFAETAALPLTTITAYEALFERLGVHLDKTSNQGKSILVVGASGGVGSIATQLANLAGLTVIATASRPETASWTKNMGSEHVINHHENMPSQIHSLGFEYVDYILCLNATESHWESMVELIAPEGKICSIVETENPIDITALQNKSATFVWEFMFTKSMYQTGDMINQHKLLNQVADWIDQDLIKTTMNQSLSPINAKNLREAHAWLETGKAIGKVVLDTF